MPPAPPQRIVQCVALCINSMVSAYELLEREEYVQLPTSAEEADIQFDGYVLARSGARAPCDVQIWLPRSPAEDAAISVFMDGPPGLAMGQGEVRITSNEQVESLGLRFAANQVLVRSGRAQPGFRKGGVHLTIAHIGGWVIQQLRRAAESAEGAVDGVTVSLSPLRYGAQPSTVTVSYLGTRQVEQLRPARRLRFMISPGTVLTWELEQHWRWIRRKDNSAATFPTPVLRLSDGPPLTTADLPSLRSWCEDTCVLITLAARHRTAAHVVTYGSPQGGVEEWRYPLQRVRGRTEEDATGPLIAEDELEGYFDVASKWWSSLDEDCKNAVRLAVFSLHSSVEQTLESTLVSRFAALEGLAKRWGRGDSARARFESMLSSFPAASVGLWPVYGRVGGVPLYWFRNEIAHGRSTANLGRGLPVAADHILLWLERVLLALMGYKRQDATDWLSRQVLHQEQEIARIRDELT